MLHNEVVFLALVTPVRWSLSLQTLDALSKCPILPAALPGLPPGIRFYCPCCTGPCWRLATNAAICSSLIQPIAARTMLDLSAPVLAAMRPILACRLPSARTMICLLPLCLLLKFDLRLQQKRPANQHIGTDHRPIKALFQSKFCITLCYNRF